MKNCLLSVDWDYFIYTESENWGSFIENERNIINLWYKRYIQSKMQGKDIQKLFRLSSKTDSFWNMVKKKFYWNDDTKLYVSDSHSLSYNIALKNGCTSVFLFDAHADLGYGGLVSLNFELNCADWLGKLLKDGVVSEAYIIYSPFTSETPEDFKQINNRFNVKYVTFDALMTGIEVSAIHVCRSGAWTPPWLDGKFMEFVRRAGLPIETVDCAPREWNTQNINLSDQIIYLMN